MAKVEILRKQLNVMRDRRNLDVYIHAPSLSDALYEDLKANKDPNVQEYIRHLIHQVELTT